MPIGLMGFGRIGRNVFRQLAGDTRVTVGAIVDIADRDALAYLLKYDSIYGPFPRPVRLEGESLVMDGPPYSADPGQGAGRRGLGGLRGGRGRTGDR